MAIVTRSKRDHKRVVLTKRQLEVLRLLADGLSTADIAGRLKVSSNTASAHRLSILNKLGVDSTKLAVEWAIRQGLISNPCVLQSPPEPSENPR